MVKFPLAVYKTSCKQNFYRWSGRTDAHTDSPKTECLRHRSNGGKGITWLLLDMSRT